MNTMQTEDDHMAHDNPFGIDDSTESPQVAANANAVLGQNQNSQFADVPLTQANRNQSTVAIAGKGDQKNMNTGVVVTTEVASVQQADNVSFEMEDEVEELGDWEIIEYEEAALCLSQSKRPPDFLNDPFKDRWKNTVEAYTKKSQYGKRKTYALKPMMVKANDDCRQEVMALQLIKRLQQLFRKTNHKIYLRPYEILITSS